MSIPSLGGSKYYVSFIDEYSGYITVVPISSKSEVLEKFKDFHQWFERKYGCKIKCFHSDGGGEYAICQHYLSRQGIEKRQYPPIVLSLTEQQKGLTELLSNLQGPFNFTQKCCSVFGQKLSFTQQISEIDSSVLETERRLHTNY